MISKSDKFNVAIENYSAAAKRASKFKKFGKTALAGFGAVAASGLFTASQAEADVIYFLNVNVGFDVSTVNASSTNAISPPFVFSSTQGAIAFGIAGNNRGPNNPVGSTDILWAVGAGYLGGVGGVFANGSTFPATLIPFLYTQMIGPIGTAPASLAWAAAGLPGAGIVIDPFGVGSTGSITDPEEGYFGFAFSNGQGQTNYGWAKVQLTTDSGLPTSFTVTDWAYDNAGDPIHAWKPVPEPTGMAGLAVLTLGAAGIRRRKAFKTM